MIFTLIPMQNMRYCDLLFSIENLFEMPNHPERNMFDVQVLKILEKYYIHIYPCMYHITHC